MNKSITTQTVSLKAYYTCGQVKEADHSVWWTGDQETSLGVEAGHCASFSSDLNLKGNYKEILRPVGILIHAFYLDNW